jgi:hypothetical protein
MGYIDKALLASLTAGCLEDRLDAAAALVEQVRPGETVLATHDDHVLMLGSDQTVRSVRWAQDGQFVVEELDIPVIHDDDVPRFVAQEVRSVVGGVRAGSLDGAELCNRLHDIAMMMESGVSYFAADAVKELDTAMDNAWMQWYEADVDAVRARVTGEIRMRESQVPSERFSGVKRDDWTAREADLSKSMGQLRFALGKIVDECAELRFPKEQKELDAIKVSLIGEARAVGAVVERAERLMLDRDVGQMAVLHDRLIERAKKMVIVAGYLARPTTKPTGETSC